jgi:hypothetical protein
VCNSCQSFKLHWPLSPKPFNFGYRCFGVFRYSLTEGTPSRSMVRSSCYTLYIWEQFSKRIYTHTHTHTHTRRSILCTSKVSRQIHKKQLYAYFSFTCCVQCYMFVNFLISHTRYFRHLSNFIETTLLVKKGGNIKVRYISQKRLFKNSVKTLG